MPRNPAMRLARNVAAVVGNAVLTRAASDVANGFSFAAWKRSLCPCCGASPDLALSTDKRRSLVCWRCDTIWRTNQLGCLGCGATAAPTLVRIPSPYGYQLAICNSCGRYLKERRGAPAHALLVERALTAGLDEAAELRGLRV
jgi:formate dehydrogenase maturation protein FdhE